MKSGNYYWIMAAVLLPRDLGSYSLNSDLSSKGFQSFIWTTSSVSVLAEAACQHQTQRDPTPKRSPELFYFTHRVHLCTVSLPGLITTLWSEKQIPRRSTAWYYPLVSGPRCCSLIIRTYLSGSALADFTLLEKKLRALSLSSSSFCRMAQDTWHVWLQQTLVTYRSVSTFWYTLSTQSAGAVTSTTGPWKNNSWHEICLCSFIARITGRLLFVC